MIKCFVIELDGKPTYINQVRYNETLTKVDVPLGEHTIKVYHDEFYPISIEEWVRTYDIISPDEINSFKKKLYAVLHTALCSVGIIINSDDIEYITSSDILAIRVRVDTKHTQQFPLGTKSGGAINNGLNRKMGLIPPPPAPKKEDEEPPKDNTGNTGKTVDSLIL